MTDYNFKEELKVEGEEETFRRRIGSLYLTVSSLQYFEGATVSSGRFMYDWWATSEPVKTKHRRHFACVANLGEDRLAVVGRDKPTRENEDVFGVNQLVFELYDSRGDGSEREHWEGVLEEHCEGDWGVYVGVPTTVFTSLLDATRRDTFEDLHLSLLLRDGFAEGVDFWAPKIDDATGKSFPQTWWILKKEPHPYTRVAIGHLMWRDKERAWRDKERAFRLG